MTSKILSALLSDRSRNDSTKSSSSICEEYRYRVKDAKVKAKNSIHIGDKSVGDDSHWDRKNIIEGGEFETDGDFHLGDG